MILSDTQAKQLQTLLKDLGLYLGEIDGKIGPQSVRGVMLLESQLEAGPIATVVPSANLSALQNAILIAARSFVGLSEIKSNAQWDDLSTRGPDQNAQELLVSLLKLGWSKGDAYCIAGAEVVWQRAFSEVSRAGEFLPYSKMLTLGVLESFNNLKLVNKTTQVPIVGAIFFAQMGNTAQGHAGIVTRVGHNEIGTIEFNTSPTKADVAKDREGDGVYEKTRPLNFQKGQGLWLRGFCNPPN